MKISMSVIKKKVDWQMEWNTSEFVPHESFILGWWSSKPTLCVFGWSVLKSQTIRIEEIHPSQLWEPMLLTCGRSCSYEKNLHLYRLIPLCLYVWAKSRQAAITISTIFGLNVYFSTLSSPQHGRRHLQCCLLSLSNNSVVCSSFTFWLTPTS